MGPLKEGAAVRITTGDSFDGRIGRIVSVLNNSYRPYSYIVDMVEIDNDPTTAGELAFAAHELCPLYLDEEKNEIKRRKVVI